MIIEDTRDLDAPIEVDGEVPVLEVDIEEHDNIHFQEFFARFRRIKDQEAHFTLRNNLVHHMWEKYIFHASL